MQTSRYTKSTSREAFPYERERFHKRHKKNNSGDHPSGALLKYKIGKPAPAGHVGFTLENDPGESYFTRYQENGFDFLSVTFHVTPRNKHWLQKIIIGDYKLQWGQGLVAWQRFLCRKIRSSTLSTEKSGERHRTLTPLPMKTAT